MSTAWDGGRFDTLHPTKVCHWHWNCCYFQVTWSTCFVYLFESESASQALYPRAVDRSLQAAVDNKERHPPRYSDADSLRRNQSWYVCDDLTGIYRRHSSLRSEVGAMKLSILCKSPPLCRQYIRGPVISGKKDSPAIIVLDIQLSFERSGTIKDQRLCFPRSFDTG